jgi:zinc transporter ZupT
MVVWSASSHGSGRVVTLGVVHSACALGSALALHLIIQQRTGRLPTALPTVRSAVWASAGGVVAWWLGQRIGSDGRAAATLAVAMGAAGGLAVYVTGQRLQHAPELAALGRLVRR